VIQLNHFIPGKLPSVGNLGDFGNTRHRLFWLGTFQTFHVYGCPKLNSISIATFPKSVGFCRTDDCPVKPTCPNGFTKSLYGKVIL
jgi:hypothetical protein